jgi:hypothetical protein
MEPSVSVFAYSLADFAVINTDQGAGVALVLYQERWFFIDFAIISIAYCVNDFVI